MLEWRTILSQFKSPYIFNVERCTTYLTHLVAQVLSTFQSKLIAKLSLHFHKINVKQYITLKIVTQLINLTWDIKVWYLVQQWIPQYSYILHCTLLVNALDARNENKHCLSLLESIISDWTKNSSVLLCICHGVKQLLLLLLLT